MNLIEVEHKQEKKGESEEVAFQSLQAQLSETECRYVLVVIQTQQTHVIVLIIYTPLTAPALEKTHYLNQAKILQNYSWDGEITIT